MVRIDMGTIRRWLAASYVAVALTFTPATVVPQVGADETPQPYGQANDGTYGGSALNAHGLLPFDAGYYGSVLSRRVRTVRRTYSQVRTLLGRAAARFARCT